MTPEPSLSPDLVTTEAAKDLLRRPVFAGYSATGNRHRYIGGHVAVNGHDIARVEAEAFARGQAAPRDTEPAAELPADAPTDPYLYESGT